MDFLRNFKPVLCVTFLLSRTDGLKEAKRALEKQMRVVVILLRNILGLSELSESIGVRERTVCFISTLNSGNLK